MNREKLTEIYRQYDLEKDDIFMLKFGKIERPIITRSGIEKIQAKLDIQVNYKIEHLSDDLKSCIILATGIIMVKDDPASQPGKSSRNVPKTMCQSFGEVSPSNNTQNYPIAMAEKRALGRVVLKMAKLFGVYTEEDSEDFKRK
tara:strand:+ start:531 stop:962 length:432 start_codon:yes stop_codon:yes gene_type:complete